MDIVETYTDSFFKLPENMTLIEYHGDGKLSVTRIVDGVERPCYLGEDEIVKMSKGETLMVEAR